MSGLSLATSAVVPDPTDVTRQVAAHTGGISHRDHSGVKCNLVEYLTPRTGCPLDVDLADCLRGKDVRSHVRSHQVRVVPLVPGLHGVLRDWR